MLFLWLSHSVAPVLSEFSSIVRCNDLYGKYSMLFLESLDTVFFFLTKTIGNTYSWQHNSTPQNSSKVSVCANVFIFLLCFSCNPYLNCYIKSTTDNRTIAQPGLARLSGGQKVGSSNLPGPTNCNSKDFWDMSFWPAQKSFFCLCAYFTAVGRFSQ